MMTLLRIILTGALLSSLYGAEAYAHAHPAGNGGMDALFLAVAMVIALPTSIVWTPVFADIIFGGILDALNDGAFIDTERQLPKWIERAAARKWHHLTAWLCFLETMEHPELPDAFVIGMEHATPGSWLERLFAREVYRSNRVPHCIKAATILEQHGINPSTHINGEINLLLFGRGKKLTPAVKVSSIPRAQIEQSVTAQPPKTRILGSDQSALPRWNANVEPMPRAHVAP